MCERVAIKNARTNPNVKKGMHEFPLYHALLGLARACLQPCAQPRAWLAHSPKRSGSHSAVMSYGCSPSSIRCARYSASSSDWITQ
eukprot:1991161-Pleurochrysis_carterae.AAC.1